MKPSARGNVCCTAHNGSTGLPPARSDYRNRSCTAHNESTEYIFSEVDRTDAVLIEKSPWLITPRSQGEWRYLTEVAMTRLTSKLDDACASQGDVQCLLLLRVRKAGAHNLLKCGGGSSRTSSYGACDAMVRFQCASSHRLPNRAAASEPDLADARHIRHP
jgi:hypothetical protein